MSSPTLYKVLDEGGRACHGGTGAWALPTDDAPGAWMPPIPDPVPCERGYHLCRPGDLVSWLGPAFYEAEARGARIDADDKIVVAEARLLRRVARWTPEVARAFATDCAARVLPLFERARPGDDRPRRAILVARDPAASAAARAAAGDAAGDAAGAAAGDAAGDAARDAERAWQTDRLLAYLAGPVAPWPLEAA
jgi:hypothetical protein